MDLILKGGRKQNIDLLGLPDPPSRMLFEEAMSQRGTLQQKTRHPQVVSSPGYKESHRQPEWWGGSNTEESWILLQVGTGNQF